MKIVAKFMFDDYFCDVLFYNQRSGEIICFDEKFGESVMHITDVVEIKILKEVNES